MEIKYSPSVNIIRDSDRDLHYIVTPNAERIATQIQNDFSKGFHSFNLIGSYGTGKSSFLWALEQSFCGKGTHFKSTLAKDKTKVRFLNFVGAYQSIVDSFAEELNVKNTLAGNQQILDAIFQEYEKAGGKEGLLVIVIDELGKYLEYASKNQPEKELYFIQQLAEFANDKERNILFLSSLHQSFEAYSNNLTEKERKEWIKVKGRLKELTFNEPVEQLLLLASEHIKAKFEGIKNRKSNNFSKLNKSSNIFDVNQSFAENIENKIYPIDLFAGYALTLSLQQYGQNERSLFTFLESTDHLGINNWEQVQNSCFNIANVYDYLLYNFYSFLSTKYNPHYSQWSGIKTAIERAETLVTKNLSETIQMIKAIGLLNLFASKGAKLDSNFLENYGKNSMGISDVDSVLAELDKRKIIKFRKHASSYKLIEGTDVDFDDELRKAEGSVDEVTDMVRVLNEHFTFPYITAKSISYIKGTPRNFEFKISDEPLRLVPKEAIDGYINLIFNEKVTETILKKFSSNVQEAVLYGFYNNVKQIKGLLFEIEKTNKVFADNQDDIVAKRELKNILDHQQNLLSHYVLDNLYSDKVTWVFKGKLQKTLNKKSFNRLLSTVCEN
ncbi:MAG: hypothetical protein IH948_04165, partial [Bacteroidetes bacterium]|nr:hypothetical protein [Bacteroidota bacterium]